MKEDQFGRKDAYRGAKHEISLPLTNTHRDPYTKREYTKRVEEQLKERKERMHAGGMAPPKYDLPKTETEFGKQLTVSVTMMDTPETEALVFNQVIQDYQQYKAENFPDFKGFPEIKSQLDPIQSVLKVGWYVVVPNRFLIDSNEEELWNS